MSTTRLSSRMNGFEGGLFSSVTKADVGDGAARLQQMGVVQMSWADPFYPDPSLPAHVKQAMTEALESGFASHYIMPSGSPELRALAAEKLARFNHLPCDPARNVLVTPGSDSGLFYALSAVIDPGDEVLVPDPSYPNNAADVRLLGGIPVYVPLDPNRGWHLDLEALRRALTPKTRAVVLTHPNNPTTTVFNLSELTALSRLILEHDLMLVVDQAFEDCVFDGRELVTPASLPGMWERTLTTFSLSKGMGLSGLRIGYIAAEDHIMDALYGAAVNVLGASNTAAQAGAMAALGNDCFMEDYRRRFDMRRRMAYEILSGVPGVRMNLPESGFFCWADVSAIGESGQITARILEQARVAVNDGSFYGPGGKGCIRIIHGCLGDDAMAMDAIRRIADCLRA